MRRTSLLGYLVIAVAILLAPWLFSYAACTPLGTSTPNFGLCKPAVGETGWGTVVNANMDTIDGNLTNSLPRSYLAGFVTTNNAAATPTKVDIAAGQAQDAGNAGAMILSSTLTKDLSASWAVGSGNGCLGTSVTRTAGTWYHVFVIKRTDTNVVDAYCDTSISAANIPSPYTLFRRIASIKTDGSANILQYTQDGDYFRWNASVLDINKTNPGTAATIATVSVVPGVTSQALINIAVANGASNSGVIVSDVNANDEAPSTSAAPLLNISMTGEGAGVFRTTGPIMVHVNSSQQIRYRMLFSDGSVIFRAATLGYFDTRGRNN